MHTKNTYAEGHAIMVNKPERAHLGEGAPETVCEMNSSLCPEVTTANQRLFVAAPDLLAALENSVRCGERDGMPGNPGSAPAWVAAARASIARAKGQTEEDELERSRR